MKRTLLYPCLLALAAAGAADAQMPEPRTLRLTRAEGKIAAPVDVEIVPLPDPGPGRRRVRVVARPSVDAPSLTIEIGAESGLSLPDGAVTWTGAARAGEEVVREVDFAVTGAGELRVVVAATLRYGESHQTSVHELPLNPRGPALTRSFDTRASRQPGGRTIIEIPAATP
ncbi:MAG TPA: hypothetical protein VHG08_26220 [Longimicrobium sp.]|nr:hypothetical protein [Longimicrobium sp.]